MSANRRADLAARAARVAGAGVERPAETTEARFSAPAQPRDSAPAEVRKSAPAEARSTSHRPGAAPRTTPVRMTVELAPMEHRRLRRYCDQVADDIGAAQVAGAEVVRVLLGLLDGDSDLAARVAQELARSGGNRRR
ncbi:hypothetical protein [Micromonospora aurantiaca (nom. illeg.)]|uniref:hypothetical protein n=1 Tax=Micromonospora aurantiaca (nom. illeg.) TaxID=47850 RepID=UPI00114CF4A8|nr:hypothetical protein [Micromonospora aurantiaca]